MSTDPSTVLLVAGAVAMHLHGARSAPSTQRASRPSLPGHASHDTGGPR
jgi:hypothetical protein